MNQKVPSNIMIIGADAHFCYLMKRYIKRSAHHMSLVDIGENIMTRVKQINPSAIILEIGKHGTLGWQILDALKGTDDTRQIPILVFTWQEDHALIKEAGADLSLRMPILFEDFAHALERVGICAS